MTEQIQIENFSQAEHEATIKGFAKTIQMYNQQRAYFDEIEKNKTPQKMALLKIDTLKQKYGFKEYKQRATNKIAETVKKASVLAEIARKSRDLVGC